MIIYTMVEEKDGNYTNYSIRMNELHMAHVADCFRHTLPELEEEYEKHGVGYVNAKLIVDALNEMESKK